MPAVSGSSSRRRRAAGVGGAAWTGLREREDVLLVMVVVLLLLLPMRGMMGAVGKKRRERGKAGGELPAPYRTSQALWGGFGSVPQGTSWPGTRSCCTLS